MKKFNAIKYLRRGKLVSITLDSPYTHNAFDDVMIRELFSAFSQAKKEKDARAIVLTGNGKSFCAGANINWLRKVKDYSFKENYKDSLELAKLFYEIYSHPLPVIGRINGAAIGGGCGLFTGFGAVERTACDISVSSDKAFFSLSELKLGVIPAVISPYIIKRLGEGRTKELFLTSERIKPQKALEYGLVNYVVPPKDIDSKVNEIFSSIVRNGPVAVLETKKLLKDLNDLEFKNVADHTAKVIAKLRISKEGQEGTLAFLEKRDPYWIK